MNHRGFALPTVIFISAALMILVLAMSQSVLSIRSLSASEYYVKIAEEAAEAGVTYASACLEKSNPPRQQTWGSNAYGGTAKPNLTQDTDCAGADLGASYSVLVANDSRIKTEFEVGNLDFVSSNATQTSSVQISSTGYARIKTGSTASITKTYQATIKKTIVWSTDLTGQRSVSGTYRTCAIMSGSAYCWGYNAVGQLGNGAYYGRPPDNASPNDSTVPVKVKKDAGLLVGKTITDIFSAEFHNCVLADGKVYCWGYNATGQLGNGTTTDSASPVEVGGALSGKVVTDVGGSGGTSCAIAEGKIYCWGQNTYGTVGNNSATSYFTTPQLVTASGTATTLPAAYVATQLSTSGSRSNNMCAIANDQAWCWGQNSGGAVGDNTTTTPRRLPTKVYQEAGILLSKKITKISQDGWPSTSSGSLVHVCVVATDAAGANGKAYCWGDNTNGQLGNNTTTRSIKPIAVRANSGDALYNKTVTDIAVGLNHSCGLANGDVFCWGANSNGQIGANTATSRYLLPIAVVKLQDGLLNRTVTAVGGGSNRSCALADAKTFCWGRNSEGQIGDGTLIDRLKPTESLFLRPKDNQYIY